MHHIESKIRAWPLRRVENHSDRSESKVRFALGIQAAV
jgi:hypothetical protein